MHSSLVPPGALHHRVTAALSNWQLDDAEQLLSGVERDPSPYVAAVPTADAPEGAPTSLGRAWADTLRAELLVRRLRVAGFTLVGDPVAGNSPAEPALDLHAGVAELIDGQGAPSREDADPRSESASRAALAIALVRSAKAAFDAADDDLQRAAGLARHARIELLSRRIDAAMDEAVEAASLLDPALPPSALLVDTLGTLAGVLADLELMPLALDYQRRAHETAQAAAADPAVLGPEDPDPDVLVAVAAARLGELCAELGEGLLDDGAPESAAPYFSEARELAERALAQLPPDTAGIVAAQVVHGWALVGMGEHAAATGPLRAAVRHSAAAADRDRLASAQLALGRALRRQGEERAADEHLVAALGLATEHGLPRLRRAALRELCTLHADLDDAGRALPYLQAYLTDELDRVDERRTRWVELFGRRKSLLETERAAGQLRRQAYEDPLTHLPNRRYAEARLDGLLAAGGIPALAVVDVDRFKSINDSIGHPGGDAVLRVVGELLVAGVRDTDEVCRWAGDEFVILLPETTAEQAERALERIRASVARYPWVELGLDVPVTISAGIASATRGDDRKTLFAAADGVLYDAKRSGRDRVVRLSALTQTRAPGAPAAPAPVTPGGTGGVPAPVLPRPSDDAHHALAAVREEATGFAPLVDPPHPPLSSGRPGDPLLGPLPRSPQPTTPAPVTAGGPEAVWATGRSTEQVLALVRQTRREQPDRPALVLRAAPETLLALAAEHGAAATMDALAMAAAVGPVPEPVGRTTVLCAGGADAPVAAEVAFVARMAGTSVTRLDDVSVSRLRALLDGGSLVADCLVVVAGMDAYLATAIGPLTDVPVVAVPTSAGQPSAFGGLGALMTMLNSSAPGVVVSTIDNGYAAGVFAARVSRRSGERP
ncbi:diguanylate cyclase domain-containing protein [Blastococcus capsensis]|uniref:diguanylate cyclase domain-containing protein n=1 Tax=Blastococcus capsensis TaxID=1564163 RepID=UPI00253FF594|nr:diguanylate cyclase [Blastococcus capsensis]MDK3258550.1 diguanylate cyclase [Blastococcus capsensis]